MAPLAAVVVRPRGSVAARPTAARAVRARFRARTEVIRPAASTPTPIYSRRPIIVIYANRISAGVNRSDTTDFAAPAYNVPTFRRSLRSHVDDDRRHRHVRRQPNRSPDLHPGRHIDVGSDRDRCLRPGFLGPQLTGPIWPTSNGYTADAYLNTPVGTDSLNFGAACLQEPVGLEQPQRHQRHPRLDGRAGPRLQRRRQSVHAPDLAELDNLPFLRHASTWPMPSRRSKGTLRSTICSRTTTSSTSTPTTTA